MWALAALALLGICLALLLVPVDLSLKIEREGTFSATLGFNWLFVHGRKQLHAWTPREKVRQKRPRRRRSSISLRRLADVAQVPGLWAEVRRLVARIFGSVRLMEVGGKVRVGTGDPADTGELWALLWPAAVWSNSWPGVDLTIEPDFSRACLTGTLCGEVRLYPARFAYSLCAAVLSMTTVRLAVVVIRSRTRRRR